LQLLLLLLLGRLGHGLLVAYESTEEWLRLEFAGDAVAYTLDPFAGMSEEEAIARDFDQGSLVW